MKHVWRLWMLLMAATAFGGMVVQAQDRLIATVSPLTETVGRYEKFEVQVDLTFTAENPYDATQAAVTAQFTAPSGRVVNVDGFYYVDHAWTGTAVRPTGEASWRVRFTPQETGTYRYQVHVMRGAASERSAEFSIAVSPSELPGFVRVDTRNPRYFAFDDGSPYIPIGLNVAWSTGDTIGDYTRWLDALSANGGNFIRVWMAPWDMAIEWRDTGLGNYGARQGQAYELDQVMALAQARGITIMLTLINHGQFNTTVNPEWHDNPYNSVNGGPCDEPTCFATHPEAIRFWEQRLRYIVARWGYASNLMAWEWWNEVNWTPLASPELLAPWITRNTALIRQLDPYGRLLTHSGSLSAVSDVWWPLDFTQDHFYNRDDFPRTFRMAAEEWAEKYPDKPFLPGEFGRSNEALMFDREGVELHLGIWSAVMTGSAGTGMSWWWDTFIHPNDLWAQLYFGISRYLDGEDLGARLWQAPKASFTERTRGRIFGLQADDTVHLWIVSRDYSSQGLESAYLDNLRAGVEDPFAITFPDITGAGLVIDDLLPGNYVSEVWDTISGEIIVTASHEAPDGILTLDLPPFNRDLAIKIRPES